ncbi:cytosolic phospholipase A2 epsilon-like [Podarcis muralis]
MGSPAVFPQILNSKTKSSGTVAVQWMYQNTVQQDAECKSIESPCYLLTVRIIRMWNVRREDYLSETDCYVTLWLPTASCEKVRTKTVANCKDPIWNETFYFRIQSQVKNVLELTVWDEDVIRDDDYRVIFFDVAKVPFGESVFMKFELNPQTHEQLEVEFALENICGPAETIITNGTIVCRELCCLEVQADRRKRKKKKNTYFKQQDVRCTLKGSFEGTQNISLGCVSNLHFTDPSLFHYARFKQAELDVLLPKKRSLPTFCCCCNSCGANAYKNRNLTLPLNTLPTDQDVIKEDKEVNLHFKAKTCTSGLDVRLGFDLCPEELEFLQKRKKVAAAAFKRALQLEEDLCEDEVPVVAIMTTGGGMRALTALYSHLLTLQKYDLLDCVSYFTGLSGTTWTMANLYDDPNWSHKNLEEPLVEVQKQLKKNKFLASFSPERLAYYSKELWQRYQEGHHISFTDLWGLIIEAMLHDTVDQNKLTDQQRALTNGQNPLPVYLCLNVKEKLSNRGFREWLEFTPYEVGFQKYGAYIRAEHFGSEFFMGHLMKKIPESRICFLEGIWSSVFSINIMDVWFMSVSTEDFWQMWTRNRITELEECPWYPSTDKLPTRMQYPPDSLANAFQNLIMWRPAVSVIPNFLRGCPMHNEYLESEFSKWKDCDLDTFPNQLTGAEDYLYLVDNAFAFESSYPPLMRQGRNVDLIIHLNYSAGSQIMPLEKAAEYFSEQGVPFPQIIPKDDGDLKECYLVGDQEGPEIPIVLLFPLVCDTFKEYKAPGVKRSPEEMEDGEIGDLTSSFGPYNVYTLRYSEKDFQKLVKLCEYNIQNNIDLIFKTLRIAVERKKQQKKS